jgi:hypothetical protein
MCGAAVAELRAYLSERDLMLAKVGVWWEYGGSIMGVRWE